MPRLRDNQIPKLRLHKPSGRAVVTLGGKDHYCGAWGSEAAWKKYNRLVAEWLAAGRRAAPGPAGPTVAEVARGYEEQFAARHRKRGGPTSAVRRVGRVMRDWEALYGDTPAGEFGPRQFRALRHAWVSGMLRKPACLDTANRYAAAVRQALRWAVAEELVEPDVLARVAAVRALEPGRDEGAVRAKVQPVAWEVVEKTLAHLPAVPEAVVRLMWHTGMRPGEAVAIRACDLERSGAVWAYRVAPEVNKTEHAGRKRTVMLGPRAQAVLTPWLGRAGPDGYLFRGRGGGPYTVYGLEQAIGRAAQKAGVPRWGPNRLRHAFGTRARAHGGLEAAGEALGHADPRTTLVYAEPDAEQARRLAAEIG